MKQEQPKVNIVIVPFDNPVFFDRALTTILENTDYNNFVVTVVHNPCCGGGVQDGTLDAQIADIARSKHGKPTVTYLLQKTNLYQARASQIGSDYVPDAKYVVLANDDIFIPGSQLTWLEKMVEFLETKDDAASVTPMLLSKDERIYWVGKALGHEENPHHDFLHVPRGDRRLPVDPLMTCYSNMACCLTRKSLLDEFSLKDGPPHYGSDSSFANRIKDKYPDMQHWVIPEIKLYHFNIFSQRANHKKDPVVDG